MAKSKAPMQLDYRTFDDKELTQVRQTAHAVGPAAKEMFAMFARVKGSEPVVGDVIAGCKIDRIQKPEAPPRKEGGPTAAPRGKFPGASRSND